MKNVKIDYLGHSGFLAETEHVLLMFDDYRGDLSVVRGKPEDKPLFVFVSHAHADHFDPQIFSLMDRKGGVRYILPFDLRGDPAVPQACDAVYMDADRTYTVEGLGIVTTLLSTDEGVAYLIKTADCTLFHAGDLHWWDWPGEDPAWLKDQESLYCREIGKLAGIPIDIGFVVLDDRLEQNYARGLEYYMNTTDTRYILPMHFWKDRSVIERFKTSHADPAGNTVLLDTAEETHWEL